ncbi:hypothetical protein F5887DRAFT_892651 [Amanita rubescens]|nr:hypothetical protein F5887DRAFT_892651 [Amanita rubescens]
MPIRRTVLALLTLLLFVCTTQAVLVNRTIDDTYGDGVTGQVPVYQPNGAWNGVNCSGCLYNPNKSLAFDGTWSAATYNPGLNNMNITFSFTGVAIWIFFILQNANDVPSGITSNTACNFTLDGLLVHTYYSPQPSEIAPGYQYNVSAYSSQNLRNDKHTLVISTNDYPINVYLNFDYAIYTYVYSVIAPSALRADNTTSSTSAPSSAGSTTTSAPSSTSSVTGTSGSAAAHNSSSNNLNNVGIIVGCVLGGLALVATLILFRRSRIKRKRPIEPIVASFNQQPLQGYRDDVMSNLHSVPGQASIVTSYDLASGSVPLVPVRRELPQASGNTLKDRDRDELRALRQMEIDMRLRTAQREMQNLASRQTMQCEPVRSSSREVLEREGSGREMEDIHRQIRRLRARISQLQMERSSDWAQGLTDEPPPPYS